MRIELLYFHDRPNHGLAEQRIREVLHETGICARIVRVPIQDDATANEWRFLGSPTIRVNGEDVALVNADGAYGLQCRFYPSAAGLDGAPSKGSIRMALERGGP